MAAASQPPSGLPSRRWLLANPSLMSSTSALPSFSGRTVSTPRSLRCWSRLASLSSARTTLTPSRSMLATSCSRPLATGVPRLKPSHQLSIDEGDQGTKGAQGVFGPWPNGSTSPVSGSDSHTQRHLGSLSPEDFHELDGEVDEKAKTKLWGSYRVVVPPCENCLPPNFKLRWKPTQFFPLFPQPKKPKFDGHWWAIEKNGKTPPIKAHDLWLKMIEEGERGASVKRKQDDAEPVQQAKKPKAEEQPVGSGPGTASTGTFDAGSAASSVLGLAF
mmetsp:Transcript_70778/g.198029  ORF Transcript_70778/g.198029 Transcript_70778/m.198029 type:complete len:274 (-) Transcript_70778:2950-3771(-)